MTSIYYILPKPTDGSVDHDLEERNNLRQLLSNCRHLQTCKDGWSIYIEEIEKEENWYGDFSLTFTDCIKLIPKKHRCCSIAVKECSMHGTFIIYYGTIRTRYGENITGTMNSRKIAGMKEKLNTNPLCFMDWCTTEEYADVMCERDTSFIEAFKNNDLNVTDCINAFNRVFDLADEEVPRFSRARHVKSTAVGTQCNENVYNEEWVQNCGYPRLDCKTIEGIEIADVPRVDKGQLWHISRYQTKDPRILSGQVINSVMHIAQNNVVKKLESLNVQIKEYDTYVIGVIAGKDVRRNKKKCHNPSHGLNVDDYPWMHKTSYGHAIICVERCGMNCIFRVIPQEKQTVDIIRK